tara:strand:- start:76 stop:720 length:645 start_codon:yes stop_codon:yes gene_type:complete
MADLRGTVRYRFRHDVDDVHVVVEGEAAWVSGIVQNLDLNGVGWTMPIARASRPQNLSGLVDGDDEPDEDAPPADLGPTPDPSRIPVVRRPIGQLDLEAEIGRIGLEAMQRPDPIELMEVVEGLDRPLPVKDPTSVDPQAEAWLKELMEVVVREHGATAMRTEDIEEVLGERLGDRSGGVLDVWLDSLFAAGKLVKVHGGQGTGWGPSPSWLKL